MTNADSAAMPVVGDNNLFNGETGLTKREHFAGLAMQGILSYHTGITCSGAAEKAVAYADALLKELEK
jgi:hypothetical protein